MRLGIDFGTTNSAITLSDGKTVHTFKTDTELPDLLPSLIYITKDFEEFAGTRARDIYLERNTNRPSRFVPTVVGEIELTVGGGSDVKIIRQEVIVLIDALSPGRLLRSVKTVLRSKEYGGTSLFGREFTVEQLIAILLGHMVRQVEAQVGKPVTQVVMGRPVKFSDDPEVDASAETKLRAAAKLVGIEEVSFLPEPIAAAYAYHREFNQRKRTFIFDFGGGTLDLTVAELGGDHEPRVLATEGVLIGGDNFDRRLMEHLLPYFGRGAKLRNGQPVPEHIWESLLDWQTTEEMKRTDTIKLIENAARPGFSSNPEAFKALHTLVMQNFYYKLLREVERAKIALSSADETVIHFDELDIEIDEPLTRQQFEHMISTEMSTISAAIDRVMARSGVAAKDVEFLVATGGSAQIPVFRQMLQEKFPQAAEMSQEAKMLTGVVEGLGVFGHDLDLLEEKHLPVERSQLIEEVQAQSAEFVPIIEEAPTYAQAVVGIYGDGLFHATPWQSGAPIYPLQAANRPILLRGLFTASSSPILLGTTLSRFLLVNASDLVKATADRESQLQMLNLRRLQGEEYTFVEKWNRFGRNGILLLVTRWGNVRTYKRAHIDKPLRELGQWQLSLRGKADPPSSLVGVKKTSTVLLVTESGRATRIAISKLSSRGGAGIKLKQPETVYTINVDDVDKVALINRSGQAQAIGIANTPFPEKPGVGRVVFRSGDLCGVLPLGGTGKPHALTSNGRLIELALLPLTFSTGLENVAALQPGERLIACWLA
jgi:hypothetical chaperone protein